MITVRTVTGTTLTYNKANAMNWEVPGIIRLFDKLDEKTRRMIAAIPTTQVVAVEFSLPNRIRYRS